MYMYIKLAVNKSLPVSVVQTSNYQFLSLENTFQKCVANFWTITNLNIHWKQES